MRECKDVAGALATVQPHAQRLEHATRALRAAMDVLPVRATRERARDHRDVADAVEALGLALAQLADALSPLREASPGFDACHARAIGMSARLARWTEEHGEGEQEADPCASDRKSTRLNSSHV